MLNGATTGAAISGAVVVMVVEVLGPLAMLGAVADMIMSCAMECKVARAA